MGHRAVPSCGSPLRIVCSSIRMLHDDPLHTSKIQAPDGSRRRAILLYHLCNWTWSSIIRILHLIFSDSFIEPAEVRYYLHASFLPLRAVRLTALVCFFFSKQMRVRMPQSCNHSFASSFRPSKQPPGTCRSRQIMLPAASNAIHSHTTEINDIPMLYIYTPNRPLPRPSPAGT